MATTQIQRRRGTKAQHDTFTGAAGEITVDTTNNRVVVHDATTAAGHPHAKIADVQNQAGVLAAVSGTANAIVLTNTPPAKSLTNLLIRFKATANNSGATTVNIDSLGVKNIYKLSGGTLVALAGGEIKNGAIYELLYDGTQFQLGSGGGAGVLTVKRQVFATAGTFTYAPDPNLIMADVELVGGGGSTSSSAHYGGGGGGYSKKLISAATIGASQSVTVGAAGGGNSTFGSILTANGGLNGTVSVSGDGGTASGGDINVQGTNGSIGHGGYGYIGRIGHGGGLSSTGGNAGICIITEHCSG